MLTRRMIFAAALLVMGCGDGRSVVSGMVTFEGKPIPEGQISFHPDDKSAATASPIKNGSYRISLSPGGTTVRIVASRVEGQTELGPGSVQYIPKRYNEASELHLDVKSGSVVHNFDLKP